MTNFTVAKSGCLNVAHWPLQEKWPRKITGRTQPLLWGILAKTFNLKLGPSVMAQLTNPPPARARISGKCQFMSWLLHVQSSSILWPSEAAVDDPKAWNHLPMWETQRNSAQLWWLLPFWNWTSRWDIFLSLCTFDWEKKIHTHTHTKQNKQNK